LTSCFPGRGGRSRHTPPSWWTTRPAVTFITLAAELLAALRLWAQRQYRSDQAVRELLKAVDPVTLREVAAELQAANDADATAAATTIRGMAQLSPGHLLAIASYAARAL
jgi:hypothetical protein